MKQGNGKDSILTYREKRNLKKRNRSEKATDT
jgi:hypothetical protein